MRTRVIPRRRMCSELATTCIRALAHVALFSGSACESGTVDPISVLDGDGNGEWIALQGRDSGQRLQIFLVRADGTGWTQLTFLGDNGIPSWSPDGQSIAFTSNRSGRDAVYLMEKDGGNQRLLVSDAIFPDWSVQNEIAYIRLGNVNPESGGLIWVTTPEGGLGRRLTSRIAPGIITGHPSWSPDGNELTFVLITPDSSSPAGFNPEIWRINRDGNDERLVTTRDTVNSRPNGAFLNTANDANAPDFGPGGWIVFWSGEETSWGQVWKIKSDGTQRTQLTSTDFLTRNDDPTWLPGGRQILFSTNRRGANEVWVMDADGSNLRFVGACPARS